jgi:ABC-type Fe3+/spermidine/putrescine transport system ATPase subunit
VHQNVATIFQNFAIFPHHTQNKKFIIEFLFIFDKSNFWEIFIEKYQKNPIQKWGGGVLNG